MLQLTGMLCCLLKCMFRDSGGSAPSNQRENPSESAEKISFDNLRRIRGIGIATENRLYRAGIKSYADLGRAAPETLERILGKPRAGTSYEAWTAKARELAEKASYRPTGHRRRPTISTPGSAPATVKGSRLTPAMTASAGAPTELGRPHPRIVVE